MFVMGKAFWWSLFLVLAPTGECREAETGGEICRAWLYGSVASSSSSSSLGPFQCPNDLEWADAKFCCGTCTSPYCCSAEAARLDQERCLESQGLVLTRDGQTQGEGAQAMPKVQTKGKVQLRKAGTTKGRTTQVERTTQEGKTTQAGRTTQVERTTQAGRTTQIKLTVNLEGTHSKFYAEEVPDGIKVLWFLIGVVVVLFILWATCRLLSKCRRWLEMKVQQLREAQQGSNRSEPPTPPPNFRPPRPPAYPKDNPPPYSFEDPLKPRPQPPARDNAAVAPPSFRNHGFQGGEEVIDMSSAVRADGAGPGVEPEMSQVIFVNGAADGPDASQVIFVNRGGWDAAAAAAADRSDGSEVVLEDGAAAQPGTPPTILVNGAAAQPGTPPDIVVNGAGPDGATAAAAKEEEAMPGMEGQDPALPGPSSEGASAPLDPKELFFLELMAALKRGDHGPLRPIWEEEEEGGYEDDTDV